MSIEPPRRRILRLAGAWLMLPLASAAGTKPSGDDPLDLQRSHGEQGVPRDAGYGAPANPVRPAPRDVHAPKPGPADRPGREPGWHLPGPLRRPKFPRGLPKPDVRGATVLRATPDA